MTVLEAMGFDTHFSQTIQVRGGRVPCKFKRWRDQNCSAIEKHPLGDTNGALRSLHDEEDDAVETHR